MKRILEIASNIASVAFVIYLFWSGLQASHISARGVIFSILGVGVILTIVRLSNLHRSNLLPEKGRGTLENVKHLKQTGHSALAIALYRELTGANLKDAHDAVSRI